MATFEEAWTLPDVSNMPLYRGWNNNMEALREEGEEGYEQAEVQDGTPPVSGQSSATSSTSLRPGTLPGYLLTAPPYKATQTYLNEMDY